MNSQDQKHSHKQLSIYQNFIFRPKYYKAFTLGLFAFLCAYVVASTFTPVQTSDASTIEITNNTTDYYIRLTSADSLPMSVEASPSGQLAIAKDTLNIITNSPNGYKLYVSTSGNDNNIYQNGSSSTSSSGYFQATTGNTSTPISLTQNTWGFALDKTSGTTESANFADVSKYSSTNPSVDSTWAAVPTFPNSNSAKISETNSYNSPGGTDIDIFYGVNASTTLPDGSYTTELTYTAISEGVNRFPTMQDFTAEQCYNMATNTSINLSDSRDDKYYRVTKMADGHCWMTDNLALDGTDAAGNVRVLTPSDSNVEQNRTLAPNIENGTAADASAIQISSSYANEVTSTCDATALPNCIVNTSTKYGNSYNWKAATAGVGTPETTDNITESICPKGWQLPDMLGVYSYSNLMLHYGLPTENTSSGGEASKTVQQSPLFFPLSGYNNNATVGKMAAFWERTTVDVNLVSSFAFNANNNDFTPLNANLKPTTIAVRCVFSGQPTDPTMQDFTTTQCNNLGTNASTVLVDRRNREFYRVVHAQDGNCWMADNLSIYGQTISAADSDFSSGTYDIPASITQTTEWNQNIYNKPMVDVAHGLGQHATNDPAYYGQVYYNWTAAVALTNGSVTTAPGTSICPSGWQLPVNGGDTTNKSWAKLLGPSSYNITTGTQLIENSYLGFTKYYGYWYLYGASENGQGSHGHFWSGTPSAETGAYHLFYNSGNVNPQDNDDKGQGFSIRCVLR